MAKGGAGVDPALVKGLNALVKEVTLTKKDDNGKQKYSLTDVMKVMNARIKLAAIEAKFEDTGYGSGFGNDDEEDD